MQTEQLNQLLVNCQQENDRLQAELAQLRREQASSQKRDRLLTTIAEVANLLLRSQDYQSVLPEVVRLLGEAVGSERCGIGQNLIHPLLNKPAIRVPPEWEWRKDEVRSSEEFSPHLDRLFLREIDAPYIDSRLSQGEVINCFVNDLPEPDRSLLAAQGNIAELFVPIWVNHENWGYIAFDNCSNQRLYDEAEIAILRIAADSIAAAIERQAKDEELQKSQQALLEVEQERSQILSTIAQVANLLLRSPDYTSVLPDVVRLLGEAVGSDRCCLVEDTLDPISGKPAVQIHTEWCQSDVQDSITSTPALESAMLWEYIPECYEKFLKQEPFNFLVAELSEPGRSIFAKQRNTSMLTVPIIVNGKSWAVIGFDNCREARLFDEAEIAILKVAADSIAAAIERQAKDEELQKSQQALVEVEQERSQELATINAELQQTLDCLQMRDRLFEATAKAANVLLTLENFDEAINTALKILVEGSGCDRINILENFYADSSSSPQYYTVLYEWARPGIIRQASHLESGCISFEGIEAFMEQHFLHGDGFGGLLDEWDEPLRSAFREVQVKSSYSVPIRVHGQWWGVLCFDYCQTATRVNSAEVAVLKTIADCIGSAIQRDRAQKIILQAEQNRVAELAKANEALKRSISHLTSAESLQSFLTAVLQEASQASGALSAAVFVYQSASHSLQKIAFVTGGEVVDIATDPRMEMWRSPVPADLTPAWQALSQDHRVFWFNISQPTPETWKFDISWHEQMGHQAIACLPLLIGEQALGFLGLCFASDEPSNESKLEQCWMLAQQATLAIQLTRLAEEAKQAALFEERNRMAGDIHDVLAQAFTGISVQLELAKYLIHQSPTEVEQILDRIAHLAQTGLTEARRSVWAIYPAREAYADLAQTLADCLEQLTQGTSLKTIVTLDGDPYPLSGFIGKNLLRIGQEAITNSLKHAQADHLWIDLAYTPTQVTLQVRDDGCGFCPQEHTDGFGLIGISERVDRLNGQLKIITQPHQGTEIFVQVTT